MKKSKIVSFIISTIMLISSIGSMNVQAAPITATKVNTKNVAVTNKLIPNPLGNGYLPITVEKPTGIQPYGIVGTYGNEILKNDKTPSDAQPILEHPNYSLSNGGYMIPDMVYWTKGGTDQNYMAYCIDPGKKGYEKTDKYNIAIHDFGDIETDNITYDGKTLFNNDMTKKLTAVASLGFNAKSSEEVLGITLDESGLIAFFGGNRAKAQEHFDYCAYLSTKFAVWSYVRSERTDGRKITIDDWEIVSTCTYPQKLKQQVLIATKRLYKEALTFTAPTKQDVKITHTNAVLVGGTTNKFESVYTITNSLPNIATYIAMKDGSEFSPNLKMYDMSGNELAKFGAYYTIPNNATSFKAIYTNVGSADFEYKCDLTLHAPNGSKMLIYGIAQKTNRQNYILAGNSYGNYYSDFSSGDFVDSEDKGKLVVEKKNGDGNTLKDAVFSFVDESGKPTKVIDMQKNEISTLVETNGTHSAQNLEYSTYYIKETKAPSGYQLDTTIHKMVVSDTTPTATITVTNQEDITSSGEWRIKKIDKETGQALSGVVFDIYNSKGQLVDSGISDSSGIYIPKGKEMTFPQAFTVIERYAPTGYQLTSPTTQVVYVNPKDGETIETVFANYKSKDVTVHKVDAETGKGIIGIELKMTRIDGKGELQRVETTDSDGWVTFDNLPDGTYTVQEVSTVGGYILDSTPQIVVVKDGQANSLKFLNSKKPSLIINKVDKSDNSTINDKAIFKVEMIDGSFVTTVETKNGIATLENLDTGTYKITEISAPKGYILEKTCTTIHLDKDKSVQVNFENSKAPILTIEKIDGQTGKAISGVKFKIEKDTVLIGEVTTGTDGKVTLGLANSDLCYLEESTYTITEVFAPLPWVVPTDGSQIKNIELKGGDNKTLYFSDLEMPKIKIIKYDEQTAELLPDAQFAIYEQADTSRPIFEGLTDSKGEIITDFIPSGTYVIKELNPPKGYTCSDKTESTRTIVAKAGDGTIVVKVDNIKLPELTIKKIDSKTKQPIANVNFEVKIADGSFVNTYTTDSTGLIKILGLKEGTYTIKEISCPNNYLLNSKEQVLQLKAGEVKTIEFENTLKPTLVIRKTDAVTLKGIANTYFKIEYRQTDGSFKDLGTKITDSKGEIIIPYVSVGWYKITETKSADGYQRPTNPVTEVFLSEGTNSYTLTSDSNGNTTENGDTQTNGGYSVTYGGSYEVVGEVINYPLNSIVIKKSDAITGEMLQGATFEVIKADGGMSGQNGTTICTVTTDISGVIVITGLESGTYIIREIKAPHNYLIAETNTQNATLKADKTSVVEVLFNNYPYGSLIITKVDAKTNKPLANATFKVTDNAGKTVGNSNGEFITNENGEILLGNLKPDSYVITELAAPQGYVIDTTPQTVRMDTDGKVYKVSFKNNPIGSLVIRKLDRDTKEPLANAEFKVTKATGENVGTSNGIFISDENGIITISNLEKGSYIVQETKAPTHYILENNAKTIEVDYGNTYTLDFYNTKMSGLQIIKIDSETKAPLKSAKFKVYKMNGELLGEYETDGDGLIILENLENGWYKVYESQAPSGYLIDDTPRDVEVKGNQFIKLVFENSKKASLIIKKIDEDTKISLTGVKFRVEKQNGEFVFEGETDANGLITIPELKPDFYVIKETKEKEGYLIDNQSRVVEIKTNVPTTVTITNKKMGGLQIKKINAVDRTPIANVEFTVKRLNGEIVGTYKTGSDGIISLSNLEGYFTIQEVKAAEGFILDNEVQTIEVKPNELKIVEIQNTPISSMLIVKTDKATKRPLEGVKFELRKSNGELIATKETDSKGRIYLNNLESGIYHVSETQPLEGYEKNEKVYEVQVVKGKQALLEVTNKKLAGLRIHKIDSITKKGIYNTEFMVFDKNNKVVGTFYSDNNGIVDFDGILEEGRYTIRETRASKGYYRDDLPRTVEFSSGKFTVITWENVPEAGQIQITKRSADDNELNGFEKGSLLEGAIFEIYEWKSGNMVDRIVTKSNGVAVSSPLPLGRYTVKEVQPPKYYKLNKNELDITVEFATQIIKVEITNESANIGVSIDKVGAKEVVQGQEMVYSIKKIRNDSTVPLNSFYWRDTLPTDAVRLNKFVTGTYNVSLKYKITALTNKGNTIIVADNLMTTKNNVIDCSPASLGLANDEFVISFMYSFGTVKAGFTSVEEPKVYVNVLNKNLPNGYTFANKVDVGGQHSGEWVIGNGTCVTKIYNPTPAKLPKTGQ